VTIRDYLNQHVRVATVCGWIAIPVGLATILLYTHANIRVFTLLLLLILVAISYYMTFSARCPRCKTRLLLALGAFGFRLAIPSWFASCPSCGLSFDTARDEHVRSNQAMKRIATRSENHFS